MFAKRQSALAATAGTAPRRRPGLSLSAVLTFMRRPVVAVVAALILMLAAGALFIAVLGDPTAGTPSARASLDRPEAAAAEPPTGMEAFTLDTLGLYQDLTAPGFELDDEGGPIQGEALITLPDGATAAGGESVRNTRRHSTYPMKTAAAPAPSTA